MNLNLIKIQKKKKNYIGKCGLSKTDVIMACKMAHAILL